ncbi:hypothetical protein ACHAXT_005183 [Thalassiosira profunda]
MCQPTPKPAIIGRHDREGRPMPLQLRQPGRAADPVEAKAADAKKADEKGLRVLICSENVPPQVNGIARRIGMYADGLEKLGCDVGEAQPPQSPIFAPNHCHSHACCPGALLVDVLHPDSGPDKVLSHVNPWNFTARMMILHPVQFFKILFAPYDVVHVVMPANLNAMWLLAAFKVLRCIKRDSKPALVVSWHCNIIDYLEHLVAGPVRYMAYCCFFFLFGMLPMISDRVLTPTRKSEPELVELWKRGTNARAGVCYTGVNKGEFSPRAKASEWGRNWQASKEKYLAKENKKHLILCVGRLSPEKGVDELIKVLPQLPDCALWLVGDGPFRPALERLASKLNVSVSFLGYQSGEALHAAYTVGDIFVCPSLTETFGQTVNEALASQVRVALPDVPVFAEAYGAAIPKDAFWTPRDRTAMAAAISKQLERHAKNDATGIPDLDKLKTWNDSCNILLDDYHRAFQDRQHTFTFRGWVWFPLWCLFTWTTIVSFFAFSQIRSLCGGSVRIFFRDRAEEALVKVRSFNRLPSLVSCGSADSIAEE